MFTESSISSPSYTTNYKYFGDAEIKDEHGLYSINGIHERYSAYHRAPKLHIGGFIKISGTITEISAKSFILLGEIDYFHLWNEKFSECPIRGTFVFSRKNHPQYWSLINQDKSHGWPFLFTDHLKGEPNRGYNLRPNSGDSIPIE